MMAWGTVILCLIPLVYSIPIYQDVDEPHVEITQDKLTKTYKIIIKTPHFEKQEEIHTDGTVFGDYKYKVKEEYRSVSYVISKESFFFLGDIQSVTADEHEDKELSNEHENELRGYHHSPLGMYTFFDDISNPKSHLPYIVRKQDVDFTPLLRSHQASRYYYVESASNNYSEDDSEEQEEENKDYLTDAYRSEKEWEGESQLNTDSPLIESKERYTETDSLTISESDSEVPKLEQDKLTEHTQPSKRSTEEYITKQTIKPFEHKSTDAAILLGSEEFGQSTYEDEDLDLDDNAIDYDVNELQHGLMKEITQPDSLATSENDSVIESRKDVPQVPEKNQDEQTHTDQSKLSTEQDIANQKVNPSTDKSTASAELLGIEQASQSTVVDNVDQRVSENVTSSTAKVLVISVPDVDSVDIGLLPVDTTDSPQPSSQQDQQTVKNE